MGTERFLDTGYRRFGLLEAQGFLGVGVQGSGYRRLGLLGVQVIGGAQGIGGSGYRRPRLLGVRVRVIRGSFWVGGSVYQPGKQWLLPMFHLLENTSEQMHTIYTCLLHHFLLCYLVPQPFCLHPTTVTRI